MDSYCEVSPSGAGVKLIVKAELHQLPEGKTGRSVTPKDVPTFSDKSPEIGLYDRGHYWCLTGQRLDDTPVNERQEPIDALFNKHFGSQRSRAKRRAKKTASSQNGKSKLDGLIQQCRDTPEGDRSEVDFALIAYAIRQCVDKDAIHADSHIRLFQPRGKATQHSVRQQKSRNGKLRAPESGGYGPAIAWAGSARCVFGVPCCCRLVVLLAIALVNYRGPETTKRYLDPSRLPGIDATELLPQLVELVEKPR